MQNKKIIIDIGTHKCEELNLLFKPSIQEVFALSKMSVKYLLGRSGMTFSEIIFCWVWLFRPRSSGGRKETKIITIEPNISVALKKITRLKKVADVDYFPVAILGHTYEELADVVSLNIYSDSLSSSIYEKNNLTGTTSLNCLGINFQSFLLSLQRHNIVGPADEIMIRMNCEGAEFSVIEALRSSDCNRLNIKVIIGSLADVGKIHGAEKYEEMMDIINDMGVKYIYFKGSDPRTWCKVLKNKIVTSFVTNYNQRS